MTPLRRAFAVLLLSVSWSWADEPIPAGVLSLEQVQTLWDNALGAFEKGQPVDQAVAAKDLAALSNAPADGLPEDVAARLKKLAVLVPQVRALQAAKAPQPPACPGLKDKSDASSCVMSAVRSLADRFELTAPGRADQVSALYLVRFNAPKDQTPAEAAKAQARLEKVFADPHVPASVGRRIRPLMGSAEAFKNSFVDRGADGGVAAASGSRGVDAAIVEANLHPRVRSVSIRAGEVPSLSERLASSAREDEEILKLGQDDGTWGTAIGRSVTQAKKAGSGLLSYFTSGETWRRTGSGAVEMVSSPVETIRFLPGAAKEAGGALWNGVKADITNASEEVGNFTDNPTPYRGAAVVGSLALAVSNAFVVGGGAKSAVRRGAMGEIDLAAKDATRSVARAGARDTSIGAAEKLTGVDKPAFDPAARAIYEDTAVQGDTFEFRVKQRFVEVSERVPTAAKQQTMLAQAGPTCVFGAVCNMYQGSKVVSPTEVLAAIKRENPAYSISMETSNLGASSVERIMKDLSTKAGRTPVTLSTTGDFLTHMRETGQPVLVGVKTGGTGSHAIVLSEAMVTKDGTVYFKTLDTNISARAGAGAARGEKFGIISSDDLDKILASKGFSHS